MFTWDTKFCALIARFTHPETGEEVAESIRSFPYSAPGLEAARALCTKHRALFPYNRYEVRSYDSIKGEIVEIALPFLDQFDA